MRSLNIIKILVLALVLVGCNLPGLNSNFKNNDVVIASGSTSERQIVAEVIKQMINHYNEDLNVAILSNLGSSILNHQALIRNDANITAIMYTGTSITGELNLEPILDEKKAYETVVRGYNDNFDLTWFPSYGFANTYTFMIKSDFSEKYNITKVSQLEAYANTLVAGVDTSWMDREGDGYDDFKEVYGFDFMRTLPMDIGLVYSALNSNSVDVVLGYSTDGRIDSYDLVTLEDDLNLFPAYDASLVISNELLKSHPELEMTLLKLENVIDETTMQRLNQLSDEEVVEPYLVAKQFLIENNYFENKEIVELQDRDLYKYLGDKND